MKSKLKSWICYVVMRPTTKDLAGRFIAQFVVVVAEFALLSVLTTSLCYAAFEDLGSGARVMGMGDAFVALADDVNASYYNPAGLTQLKRIEIQVMYAGYYLGLSDGISDALIGYGQKLKEEMGAFGLNYLQRRLPTFIRKSLLRLHMLRNLRQKNFHLVHL